MRRIGLVTLAALAALATTQHAAAQEDKGMAMAGAGGSDHSKMVGRLAVGYLGKRTLPLRGVADQTLQTPVVGVRYWMDPGLGLDLGLGFSMLSGEDDNDGMTSDRDDALGVMIHGGVPLSLAASGHFSFQIVPELNVGIGSGTDYGGIDTDHSSFLLEVGARAGAEVHFGFIDIPELSLQGGLGLMLQMANTTADQGGVEIKQSTTQITTTTNQDPWNIFTGNISALYYF